MNKYLVCSPTDEALHWLTLKDTVQTVLPLVETDEPTIPSASDCFDECDEFYAFDECNETCRKSSRKSSIVLSRRSIVDKEQFNVKSESEEMDETLGSQDTECDETKEYISNDSDEDEDSFPLNGTLMSLRFCSGSDKDKANHDKVLSSKKSESFEKKQVYVDKDMEEHTNNCAPGNISQKGSTEECFDEDGEKDPPLLCSDISWSLTNEQSEEQDEPVPARPFCSLAQQAVHSDEGDEPL